MTLFDYEWLLSARFIVSHQAIVDGHLYNVIYFLDRERPPFIALEQLRWSRKAFRIMEQMYADKMMLLSPPYFLSAEGPEEITPKEAQ